jgi:chemotaxis protein CheX
MPATQDISEAQIRESIVRAMSDVFKTMLGRFVQLRTPDAKGRADLGPTPSPAAPPPPKVIGTVGFLGDANGVIYLYFEELFAQQCTANMLGLHETEIAKVGSDQVNDAIGELTNMVVGCFKNGLCDAGYPCKLTIPSILRGINFCIGPISSVQRHVYSFDCRGHRVVADILMKSDE